MLRCEFCGGQAAQLARTATRIWLGCSRCHRTWNVDAESGGTSLHGQELSYAARSEQLSLARGCMVAALAVVLALGVRMMLRPALGNASPFLLFTPAVAIAAFYGGIVPGALTTALSTALGSHFLLDGIGEPVIEKWDRVILFVVVGAVITGSSTVLRRSRQQLAASLWREQKARAMAEAADRTKDDFLALISHELQSPLTVVLGWIATMTQRRLNPDALAHAIEAVDRNARILSRLVDDILDRSRIATGTLHLDPQEISLVTVVRAAADQVRPKIQSAGVHFTLAVPSEESAIVGDSIRLQQVFTNLLSNAVKFTPRGGHISVALRFAGGDAHVTVADTGAGIAADVLPRVFDAFRQAPETLRQSPRGLGLGLSIARYLIEQHDGTITARSEGRGRGSVFTVTLPLARQSRAEVPLSAAVGADAHVPVSVEDPVASPHGHAFASTARRWVPLRRWYGVQGTSGRFAGGDREHRSTSHHRG